MVARCLRVCVCQRVSVCGGMVYPCVSVCGCASEDVPAERPRRIQRVCEVRMRSFAPSSTAG